MRAGRTLLALIVLFVGVLALLVLRYDAWVYARMLDHPIAMTLLVGTALIMLVLDITHRVQDPKRAVVFKEGRFHQLDPRGEILVWPGMDIGAEVSLAEQRVLGWPVMLYDGQGKEHTFIFGLTWRIVPTGPRPGPREQRTLLMPNGERRTIVVQAVERAMRDVARLCSPEQLRELAADSRFLEALRDRVNAEMVPDALVVDRLHVVRMMLSQSKKEEPQAGRASPIVVPAPGGVAQLPAPQRAGGSAAPALPPPHSPAPAPSQAPTSSAPVGSPPHLAGRAAAGGSAPRPLLSVADHAAILGAICQRIGEVRERVHGQGDQSGLAALDAVMERLPPLDPLGLRVALASFIARALRHAFPQVPPAVTATVNALMLGLDLRNPAAAAAACLQQSEASRQQGDIVLADALALAHGVAANGAATIFDPAWLAATAQANATAAERLLRASIEGVLTGFLLGTMLTAAAQSPQLAAVLISPAGTLVPQDAAMARAIEQAAEEALR